MQPVVPSNLFLSFPYFPSCFLASFASPSLPSPVLPSSCSPQLHRFPSFLRPSFRRSLCRPLLAAIPSLPCTLRHCFRSSRPLLPSSLLPSHFLLRALLPYFIPFFFAPSSLPSLPLLFVRSSLASSLRSFPPSFLQCFLQCFLLPVFPSSFGSPAPQPPHPPANEPRWNQSLGFSLSPLVF